MSFHLSTKLAIHFKSSRIRNTLSILLLFTAILSAIFFLDISFFSIPREFKLRHYTQETTHKCARDKDPSTCYTKEIPKLMDFPIYFSMEDAFEITKQVQSSDSSFKYCHVLAHKLSAKEEAKNPDNWAEIIPRCPTGVCSNGCMHGIFQEKFKSESLDDQQIDSIKTTLKKICTDKNNWQLSRIERGSCYHALGHLNMYMTNANLSKSISLCKELSFYNKIDYSLDCFDGVFMQIYQPLEPEDFALVKNKQPKVEEIDRFCDQFQNPERGSCISESWPLFESDIYRPGTVDRICNKEAQNQKARCYRVLFNIIPILFKLNPDKLSKYCSALTEEQTNNCFKNIAYRMIQVDYNNISQAVRFCTNYAKGSATTDCFDELVRLSNFLFKPRSDNFYKLCNSLPEGWKDKCLSKK